MIGYLSGKLISADEAIHSILLDVGGVGYQLFVPWRLMAGLTSGSSLELFVVTNLRENALELFGFSTAWEKKVFLTLTQVSGIGPKTALGMLGSAEPEVVLSAILREDKQTLTCVPGVGKKTAERLVLELAEKAQHLLAEKPKFKNIQKINAESKIQASDNNPVSDVSNTFHTDLTELWHEALGALVNLGYQQTDALHAIKQASQELKSQNRSLPDLIRSSLQCMARIRGVNG